MRGATVYCARGADRRDGDDALTRAGAKGGTLCGLVTARSSTTISSSKHSVRVNVHTVHTAAATSHAHTMHALRAQPTQRAGAKPPDLSTYPGGKRHRGPAMPDARPKAARGPHVDGSAPRRVRPGRIGRTRQRVRLRSRPRRRPREPAAGALYRPGCIRSAHYITVSDALLSQLAPYTLPPFSQQHPHRPEPRAPHICVTPFSAASLPCWYMCTCRHAHAHAHAHCTRTRTRLDGLSHP